MAGVLDSFSLEGRTIVITGASSGLGAAVAVAVAEAGADVVLGARRLAMLETTAAVVEAVGRRAVVVATDVAVVEDCQRLVARASEAFGEAPGRRRRHDRGRIDRQRLEHPGPDQRRAPAGGLRHVQGGPARPDPGPGGAVVGPQVHPGQCAGPGLLRVGDDRSVPARLPR